MHSSFMGILSTIKAIRRFKSVAQLCFLSWSLTRPCSAEPRRALGLKPSWVKELAQALLRVQDANVLMVDWVYGASFAYNLVVENYKEVAVQISILINQLQVRDRLEVAPEQSSFNLRCFQVRIKINLPNRNTDANWSPSTSLGSVSGRMSLVSWGLFLRGR